MAVVVAVVVVVVVAVAVAVVVVSGTLLRRQRSICTIRFLSPRCGRCCGLFAASERDQGVEFLSPLTGLVPWLALPASGPRGTAPLLGRLSWGLPGTAPAFWAQLFVGRGDGRDLGDVGPTLRLRVEAEEEGEEEENEEEEEDKMRGVEECKSGGVSPRSCSLLLCFLVVLPHGCGSPGRHCLSGVVAAAVVAAAVATAAVATAAVVVAAAWLLCLV